MAPATVAGVNRRRLASVVTGLFLVAAVAFAALLLRRQWTELGRLRGGAGPAFRLSPGWLGAALLLATANLGWMGAIWVHLYRAGGGVLGYRRGIAVWVVTNLGRYIPGKVWQLSGLALHLRRTGGSGALALSSSLGYQVVTLLTGAAVACVTVAGDLASLSLGRPVVWGGILVVLALFLHPAFLRRATEIAARVTREEVGEAGAPRGRDLAAAGAGLFVSWGIYGLGFWCLMRGLWSSAPTSVAAATGIFAAAYVVGYLVLVAPGGLVVREGAMTALIAALSPLGAGSAAATAIAARAWTVASEIVALGATAAAAGGGSSRGESEEPRRSVEANEATPEEKGVEG